MTAAIMGILGFATLFALVGFIPLETGGCHGSCSAENATDCAACPYAPGGEADGGGWDDGR